MSDIKRRIQKVLKELCLNSFATMDSLDRVEVAMGIEEEFGIELPDLEDDRLTSMQYAVSLVEKYKKLQEPSVD